jgi:HSP20 family molecular chaperone IbpA
VTEDLDPLLLTRHLHLLGHERFEPGGWRPPADVYRSPHGWLVKLDLAGVAESEVEVRARGGRLVIRGRRGDPGPGPGYARECQEIRYSAFERVIELAAGRADLERARIGVRHERGMLLVRIDTQPEEES